MIIFKQILTISMSIIVMTTGAFAMNEAHAGLQKLSMIRNKAVVYQDDANSEIVIGYEGKMTRLTGYTGEDFRILSSQNYQEGFLVLAAISNGTSCEMNTKFLWFTGKEILFADGIPTCYAKQITSRLNGNQMTIGFDGKSKVYPLVPPEPVAKATAPKKPTKLKINQKCYDDLYRQARAMGMVDEEDEAKIRGMCAAK